MRSPRAGLHRRSRHLPPRPPLEDRAAREVIVDQQNTIAELIARLATYEDGVGEVPPIEMASIQGLENVSMGVRRRRAGTICAAALVVGCGGGSDGLRVSLADVDPAGGYWAIRATCEGGDLDVEFRPSGQLAVRGFGRASDDEIVVECGEPVRVTVTDEELRRRGEDPTGADLAAPTFEATELSCLAEGRLVVSAYPVFSGSKVGGGGLCIERGGQTILFGAVAREDSGPPSGLDWWRRLCRR